MPGGFNRDLYKPCVNGSIPAFTLPHPGVSGDQSSGGQALEQAGLGGGGVTNFGMFRRLDLALTWFGVHRGTAGLTVGLDDPKDLSSDLAHSATP